MALRPAPRADDDLPPLGPFAADTLEPTPREIVCLGLLVLVLSVLGLLAFAKCVGSVAW